MNKIILVVLLLLSSHICFGGTDISSTIDRIQLKNDDKLWIKMKSDSFNQYCKPGWLGFNLFIPKSDKNFPYYYGLLTNALSKNQVLFIANISHFDGSTACDLTQTGYGIVILSQ